MKKNLLILVLLFFSSFSFAQQDTIYLNDKLESINSREKVKYFKVIKRISENRITEMTFLTSKQLKYQTTFLIDKKDRKIRDGKHKVFYPNGKPQIEIDFSKGKRHGEFIGYWENGRLKRKDIYKKNKFLSGECWDPEGKETEYFDYEKNASYLKGKNALKKYFIDKIKIDYSRSKIKNWDVMVKFYINKNGKVSKPELINKSHDIRTDVMIVEAILNMPKWKPAMRDNKTIGTWKVLPIKLRH